MKFIVWNPQAVSAWATAATHWSAGTALLINGDIAEEAETQKIQPKPLLLSGYASYTFT